MQSSSQPAASATSDPDLTGFAAFLSALASPEPAPQNTTWNDDALASDVATLSYENALKTHSRYKPAAEPLPQLAAVRSQDIESALNVSGSVAVADLKRHDSSVAGPKSASITIRMSEAECVQLKQRAAEAGMTISAYLRSCTFEAEALRGQVKEALAQLRSASSPSDKQSAAPVPLHKKRDWLSRILPRHGLRHSPEVN